MSGQNQNFYWWHVQRHSFNRICDMGGTQQAHNIKMMSYQRRCDVITSHRRWYDVILTLCAHWVHSTAKKSTIANIFLSHCMIFNYHFLVSLLSCFVFTFQNSATGYNDSILPIVLYKLILGMLDCKNEYFNINCEHKKADSSKGICSDKYFETR